MTTYTDGIPHTRGVGAVEEPLLDHLAIAVLLATTDGEVRGANPAWTALTHLSESDSGGRGWLHAVHADDRTGLLEQLADPRAGEVICRLAGGTRSRWTRWTWLSCDGSPTRPVSVLAAREASEVQVVQRDLTVQHRSASTSAEHGEAVTVDIADLNEVVEQLFRIGWLLAGCRSIATEPVDGRLVQAGDLADTSIGLIRRLGRTRLP